ncbi:hypothetical protein V5O48_009809 [Marasmius crinis-equi]|uniref:DUF6534 domain-containing protein n=1 Tax=Marasmius crinis-equi TaxID=585013 RepID=A0ABR3FA40_9AGAR
MSRMSSAASTYVTSWQVSVCTVSSASRHAHVRSVAALERGTLIGTIENQSGLDEKKFLQPELASRCFSPLLLLDNLFPEHFHAKGMSTPPLDSTIGMMFIGTVIGTALWGITCVQTWFYFDNYPNDGWLLKSWVIATFISDTAHEILVCQIVYMYFVSNFGDYDATHRVLTGVYVEVLINGLTGLLVQIFLSYRIWTCTQGALIAGGFATAAAYMAMGIASNLDNYDQLKGLRGLSMSINVLAVITDLTISAAICTYLNVSRTGYAWSNHVINRLILFSINTGLVTSFCACMSLITILVWPDTLIYFAFYFIIGRFYSNSLMATLNARKSIKNGPSSNSIDTEAPDTHTRSRATRVNTRLRIPGERRSTRTGIQVQIDTVLDKFHDDRLSQLDDGEEQVEPIELKEIGSPDDRDDAESGTRSKVHVGDGVAL